MISVLDYLTIERRKNKSLKEELIELKKGYQNPNFEEVQHIITNLKVQIEEARRIEEACNSQSQEKHFLEAKIVAQRKKVEKREDILTSHLKERSEDLNKT